MSPSDPRSALLHAFDSRAADLTADRARHVEAGAQAARDEIAALTALAGGIGRAVTDWRALMAPVATERPFDTRRAGALILESVFDEILPADAWSVLAAAFDLTPAAA